MIRFAVPALALGLAFAAPASAAPAPAAPAAQTAADPAVSIEAVRAWLISKGGDVGPVQREDGNTWITVNDDPLHWVIFFYDCREDRCGAIQYSASFSNPTITQEMVNDWNRDRRFLKAYFLPAEAGGEPTAVVQHDVLVHSDDVEQLTDSAALWLNMVGEFGTVVGYFAAE